MWRFRQAATAARDLCFGLHLGAVLHPRDLGLVGYLGANAASLGDVLGGGALVGWCRTARRARTRSWVPGRAGLQQPIGRGVERAAGTGWRWPCCTRSDPKPRTRRKCRRWPQRAPCRRAQPAICRSRSSADAHQPASFSDAEASGPEITHVGPLLGRNALLDAPFRNFSSRACLALDALGLHYRHPVHTKPLPTLRAL